MMQRIVKAVADRVLAAIALIVLSPVMLIAAVGIKCTSKGPVFYKPLRMGKGMKPIVIYKFRTMRVGADREGLITGAHDDRVYAWGGILRKTKIDELPQLINILIGNMSIVGPRPEDVEIAERYYTPQERRTLDVLPGLACPGSIFSYTHGDAFLSDSDTDESYVHDFLHVKLALDLYYLDHWNLAYDLEIVCRTLYAILVTTCTKKRLPYPREYRAVFGGEGNAQK